jgi:putative transcriptional regulator
LRQTQLVDAVIALARRGAPLLKAKRAVEAAMDERANVLDVPMVEDRRALAEELPRCGFDMAVVANQSVDVKDLRERLSLTQEQFAARFRLELDAARNWERGRREPDTAAAAI